MTEKVKDKLPTNHAQEDFMRRPFGLLNHAEAGAEEGARSTTDLSSLALIRRVRGKESKNRWFVQYIAA